MFNHTTFQYHRVFTNEVSVVQSINFTLYFQLLTSLNMCLVVGLAVDYVVHLAEAYTLSLHKDRYNRTRDMLEEMGPSVFSGACTTLGASIFMFAAQVQFFMQFGVFMFCTIGFSLIFSLGLFTMLVGLIGPQNNIGNLKVLFQKCRSKCQKKAKKTWGWILPSASVKTTIIVIYCYVLLLSLNFSCWFHCWHHC